MIDVKELRIGNWIFEEAALSDSLSYCMVESISKDTIDVVKNNGLSVTTRCYYCRPIPLSPEVLMACGFENDYSESWTIKNGAHYKEGTTFFTINFFTSKFQFSIGTGSENTDYVFLKIPQSLHQLQNLYFALTGKELEFSHQ
jgi:hypothetical protein